MSEVKSYSIRSYPNGGWGIAEEYDGLYIKPTFLAAFSNKKDLIASLEELLKPDDKETPPTIPSVVQGVPFTGLEYIDARPTSIC